MVDLRVEYEPDDDATKPPIKPELEVMICTVIEAMLFGREWVLLYSDGDNRRMLSSIPEAARLTSALILAAARMLHSTTDNAEKTSEVMDLMLNRIDERARELSKRHPQG